MNGNLLCIYIYIQMCVFIDVCVYIYNHMYMCVCTLSWHLSINMICHFNKVLIGFYFSNFQLLGVAMCKYMSLIIIANTL